VQALEQPWIAPGKLSEQAFGAVVERYRNELQAHCYRMLGSIHEAEDMVQETFLRAWTRRDSYRQDISLRAWLYKIATNICLDTLKKQRRRVIPRTLGEVSNAVDPIPASVNESIWLEPYPDDLLAWDDEHPETAILTHERISIAFLAALQLLPPRQRAALILSDVLEWRADEIANLLDTTVPAVKSALHRARARLANLPATSRGDALQPVPDTVKAQLGAYVAAWQTGDVERLIQLLHDDATFSMPPIPSWYQGREQIGALIARTIFAGDAQGRWHLRLTRANRQIAFGLYRRDEAGVYQAYGVQVLTFKGDLLADIITFRVPSLVRYFNLPTSA
jgi:RNA polymerase sigma-70 factor (ECF subfamily)